METCYVFCCFFALEHVATVFVHWVEFSLSMKLQRGVTWIRACLQSLNPQSVE